MPGHVLGQDSDERLRPKRAGNANLQRFQVVSNFIFDGCAKTLAGEPAQGFADSHWPDVTVLFVQGEQASAGEVRRKSFRDAARDQNLQGVGEGLESRPLVSLADAVEKVLWAQPRRTCRRTFWEAA